jgi:hypothetical protein
MLIHVLSVLPDGSVHWTGTPLPAKLDVRTSLDSEERRASHQEFQIQSVPIPQRVRRNRQRLPSSLLIENASRKAKAGYLGDPG